MVVNNPLDASGPITPVEYLQQVVQPLDIIRLTSFYLWDGRPPRLTSTKTPEIGWGFITGRDRDSIFEGIEPKQADAWLHISQNQNPILVTVADSRTLEAPQRIAVICTLISGTLNIDSRAFEVSLATPALSTNGTPSTKIVTVSALVLGIPRNLLSHHLGETGQTTFASGGQAIHLS
ncbi:hypothetical protein GYMLUDRAFT_242991 [Collybiopsis luxurians FD-317 M1]|uniref:Uncharacterized protein n=1 Tax=Collybiopsis luxurians FD-317 M1 TaxID=944289 RepID=A0A0D0CI37_9AGAR|nr:hypothetical protein GYMLUDRAFT_242991 [Collybiopsis luxurians FD-317 M1]